MPTADQKRLRVAREELARVVAEIVEIAEEKNHMRCPYRTAVDSCTFAGGCENQERRALPRRCAGDEAIFGRARVSGKQGSAV